MRTGLEQGCGITGKRVTGSRHTGELAKPLVVAELGWVSASLEKQLLGAPQPPPLPQAEGCSGFLWDSCWESRDMGKERLLAQGQCGGSRPRPQGPPLSRPQFPQMDKESGGLLWALRWMAGKRKPIFGVLGQKGWVRLKDYPRPP